MCVLDVEGGKLLPQQERLIKKQTGSSEARLMPVGAWEKPPWAQPLSSESQQELTKARMRRQQTLS